MLFIIFLLLPNMSQNNSRLTDLVTFRIFSKDLHLRIVKRYRSWCSHLIYKNKKPLKYPK